MSDLPSFFVINLKFLRDNFKIVVINKKLIDLCINNKNCLILDDVGS